MNEVIFRRATLDDVEGIIDLCNESFGDNTNYEYAKGVFKNTMLDKNQIYLIGLMDNRIVAHTKITIIPTMFNGMDTYAIVNHVCVKPEYRRHNIATKMLDEVAKICKENNARAIKLWSLNFREAAHACYKHYGFKVDDAAFFTKDLINE